MCDCLVVLPTQSATGRTLFAKNSDRPPTESQVLRHLPSRREPSSVRATYIDVEGHHSDTLACLVSMPEWCWGAEHGVNEAGVAAGNETIYTTLDPRGTPDALTGMDLVRLVLQRAESARDGVGLLEELIARYGQGGSGHDTRGGQRPRPYWSSFLVADAQDAWVVETSGNLVETMQVSDSWAISNRTTIPSFDAAHRHPRQPVERLVDPRLDASRAVLAGGMVSVDDLRTHLSSHVGGESGWTVCMHAVEDGELVEKTTASMVAEIGESGWTAWCAQGSPCTDPWVPVTSTRLGQVVTGR